MTNPGLSVYNQWLLPPSPARTRCSCMQFGVGKKWSERVQSKMMEEIHAFYVIVQPKVGLLFSSMRKTVAWLRTQLVRLSFFQSSGMKNDVFPLFSFSALLNPTEV